jgi:hypothetical protein
MKIREINNRSTRVTIIVDCDNVPFKGSSTSMDIIYTPNSSKLRLAVFFQVLNKNAFTRKNAP